MNDDKEESGNADTSRSAHDPSTPGCVDWKAALSVAAGDKELLVEVLEAFQTETPQMVTAIGQALAARDVPLLHRAAHTVKNACYNIGAQVTGDIAFEIEMLGKESQLDGVPPLLERLEVHMRQVEQQVEEYLRANRSG